MVTLGCVVLVMDYVQHPTLSPPGATSDSVIASPYVMNVDALHSLALRLAKEPWQDYAHRAAVAWSAVSTAGTGTDDPRRAKHTRQAHARFFRMARDSIHAVAQSTVAHIRRILSTKPGSHTALCLENARQRPRRSSHQLCARVIPAAPARNAPRTSSLSAHRGRGTRPWPSPGGLHAAPRATLTEALHRRGGGRVSEATLHYV